MKLVSFRIATPLGAAVRVGAMIDRGIVDLNLAYAAQLTADGRTDRARHIADAMLPPDMIAFFEGGQLARDAAARAVDFARDRLDRGEPATGDDGQVLVHDRDAVTLLAPVPRPASIRDTLSFEGHMKNFERRTGTPTPEPWYRRPIYYKGNPASVIGPDAPIEWPDYTDKLDYELEFGVFIGRRGRNISADEAGQYIAGYTIFNDVSARDVIPEEVSLHLGPAKGKDMDGGNVLGPCLVTPDELDPSDLDMTARVNGEVWSAGNSADMYFSFGRIIAFISCDETLHPGDFIGSGTVADGCGDELERWIKPGDVVELEVEGIGTLRNPVVRREAGA